MTRPSALLQKCASVAVALVLIPVLMGSLTGCRGQHAQAAASTAQKQEATMSRNSHEVYAGRAVMQVPEGTEIKLSQMQVNQVNLRRLPLPAGADGFEQSWRVRVEAIRSGHAHEGSHSTLTRDLTGEYSVLYNETDNAGLLYTLEHWQPFGDRILIGDTTVRISPRDGTSELDEGRKAIRELFAAISIDRKPGPGDFVFDGGVAHVPLLGGEHAYAEWTEHVAGETPGKSVPLQFTLSSTAVSVPGKPDLLHNQREATLIAAGEPGVHMKVLRSGIRTVAGMQGEEGVTTIYAATKAENVGFDAAWQAGGKPNDALSPSLDTSAKADRLQGLAPGEVLLYWDYFLQTLRFH